MESISNTGITFQQFSTGGIWSWTVSANNTQGVGQLYQIDSIMTPFGKLVDISVPIPADIVFAMSDSVLQCQSQFAPLLTLVSTSSISAIVTEGDPNTDIGFVIIQNSGAFGSFMNATASSDSPWLSGIPSTISGLGRSQQGQFRLRVNPASLLSGLSPYSGRLNLQDNRNPPTVIPVTVNLTVLPRPLIAASPASISFTVILSNISPISPEILTISNGGPGMSQLSFVVAKLLNTSSWLLVSPTSGGPLTAPSTVGITLSLWNPGVPKVPGTFNEILRITSSNASNSPVDIPIILTVLE